MQHSCVYRYSRYLFFLARRGHAPKFLAMLIRFPRPTTTPESKPRDVDDMSTLLVQPTPVEPASVIRSPPSTIHQYTSNGHQFPRQNVLQSTSEEGRSEDAPRQPTPPEPPVKYVLPLASVLVSSSVGLLAFMTVRTGGPAEVLTFFNPKKTLLICVVQAFLWMAQVTSVASLQSWIGMLFTYLRFWQGTRFAEKREAGKSKEEQDRDGTFSAIERIKKHRHKGQPFVSHVGQCLHRS
jgi:amino acid transporter